MFHHVLFEYSRIFWPLLQFSDAVEIVNQVILDGGVVILVMRARSRGVEAGNYAPVWSDPFYF